MLDVSGGFSKNKKFQVTVIIGGLLLIVAAGLAVYFYQQYANTKTSASGENQAAVSRVTTEVSNMLKVPTNEEPQVALINDPEQLKDQSFYADAQKGDYLVVYKTAQLAIIYREKDHLLVNVDHVEIKPATQNATTPTTKK